MSLLLKAINVLLQLPGERVMAVLEYVKPGVKVGQIMLAVERKLYTTANERSSS
jgi:uncharacterized pyridoxamine 5'-phosphate oxidase family protein